MEMSCTMDTSISIEIDLHENKSTINKDIITITTNGDSYFLIKKKKYAE